ncbi:serine/threonine-protein kinase [Streptomonospora litoralis]|uniref:non-specific serine/threonine protein kinase n=1 Tax=Streptomonospora litoralis TaxID=2498135 RepID=A0A4P6Q0R1_9ACTN|nr:serine/threonine-protein kinase [Streptomonospora litoralis]QBI53660.1 Serine/threonine-protein kinase PrkC [Streptomonospora litoralis]
MSPANAPQPRSTVLDGRYDLRPVPLARGGMGEVWEGHDTRLDREVAVKFIRFPDGERDEEMVRRFVRESRITARLRHPGVPAVYDAGSYEGRPYLVMERVHGISIADLVAEQERLEPGWAAAVAAQVCSVLAAAHGASLVHRDLKPTNLMLEPEGTVKVLDFGLAVALEGSDGSRITRSGETPGTAAYMSPEQLLTGVSTPRSDLYALGCALYEMLTGVRAFTGSTPFAVMAKQVGEAPPQLATLRPDAPEGLRRVVEALLAKAPEERPGGAEEAYRALLPHASALGPIPGVLHPPALPSPVRMQAAVLDRVFADRPGGPGAAADTDTGTADAGATAAADAAPDPVAADPPASAAGGSEPPADGRGRPGTTLPAAPTAASSSGTAPAPSSAPSSATGGMARPDIGAARSRAAALATDSRYRQAADVLQAAVETATAAFGSADSDVVELRMDWANVLFEGGDFRGAAPVYASVATDLTRRHGEDDPLVFRCRLQHATCRALLGETDAALETLRRLLADEERVYGAEDQRPLELRRQIGLLELGAGRRDRAGHTLHTLADDLRRIHGPDHPALAQVLALLQGPLAETDGG